MSIGVSNSINQNNLTFSKNAVKYLQDGKLTEDSLGKQVKDSALGSLPFAGLFGVGLPALGARKLVKNNPGMKFGDAFEQKIKESSGIASGTPKQPGKIAKFLRLDKLGKWFKNTWLGKTKIVKGLSKLNIGSFFAFNMLFSLTEVVPAFKDGGVVGGVKQIGKSVAGAAVDAVAYAGGMKLGAMAGAKVGAMIGTAGGPVGAAIGAVAGIVLGGVASTVGAKLCKGIFGKNHSELKADEEKNQVAEQIASDDAALAEVKTAVEATVMEKAQSGKLTADDLAILEQAQAVQVATPTQQSEPTFQGAKNETEQVDALNTTAQTTQANTLQTTAQATQANAAQPMNTVAKPQDSKEQIRARLQKIPEDMELNIDYEVPSDYAWTTAV